MTDKSSAEFLAQLQERQTRTARREFQSRCLLAASLAMAILTTAFWRLWVGAHDAGFGFSGGAISTGSWTIKIPDWLPEHTLRTLVVISFVAFGCLALLHFAVIRPAAQACRQQRSLALMVELEQALQRQSAASKVSRPETQRGPA